MSNRHSDEPALAYAERWCSERGPGWVVKEMLGRGGTAPVFYVKGPGGDFALKMLDEKFSTGDLGRQTILRIEQQIKLGSHGCPNLVVCSDGGKFEDRLFLLMSLAEGYELEKRLDAVPRSKIRAILDQVAKAAIFLRSKGLCHRDIKSANIFISEDFERATLLDLSVIREINDPVGIGTDHDNQLPVVATSRYTPPEYLFRLQDPTPELWHGVDVYQLGGLLHDLIMRKPLFSNEYAASSENRYRFAWIVATVDPVVDAVDVDTDLVLLARRALDKKWDRRRQLLLEDFLEDRGAKVQSLAAIGIAPSPRPSLPLPPAPKPSEVHHLAKQVEEQVRSYLTEKMLRTTHSVDPGRHDREFILQWSWELNGSDTASRVTLRATLEVWAEYPLARVGAVVEFCALVDGRARTATITLPDSSYSEHLDEDVGCMIVTSLGDLATRALSVREEGG